MYRLNRYKPKSKGGWDTLLYLIFTRERFLRRTEKASSALGQNRKEIALGHLRARKQLEDTLVKRSKALENLESTLWTVEQATGDVEVIPLSKLP